MNHIIKNILPNQEELSFLINYFETFSQASLYRYGKTNLDDLDIDKFPLYLDTSLHLVSKNGYHKELNEKFNLLKNEFNILKSQNKEYFSSKIVPDFSLKIDNSFSAHFKIFKANNSFFLLQYNILLEIKIIVPFHSEKTDYYEYQKDFIYLLEQLILFINEKN